MRGRRKIQLDDSQIAEVAERHNRHESTRKFAAAIKMQKKPGGLLEDLTTGASTMI
jgi:hypothetical protein